MFRALYERFDRLSHKLDLIETVLMVREPGSVKAAEAYEGLRRQVVAAVSEHHAHLAHLAQFDAAVQGGQTGESLSLLVRDFMQQAGLERVDDPTDTDKYEVVDGKGDQLVVLEPAYIEASTGRLVRQGRARAESRADHPATSEADLEASAAVIT